MGEMLEVSKNRKGIIEVKDAKRDPIKGYQGFPNSTLSLAAVPITSKPVRVGVPQFSIYGVMFTYGHYICSKGGTPVDAPVLLLTHKCSRNP